MSVTAHMNETDPLFFTDMRIIVNNLNSQDSRIAAILINDEPAGNYTSTDEYNNPRNYGFYDRLKIPAGGSKEIFLNFSNGSGYYPDGLNVSSSMPLKVTVFSSNANTFTGVFRPPTALARVSIETEDLGVAQRDVLVLDASDSFDDGSILSYTWKMYSFNGSDYTQTAQYSGKKVKANVNQTGDVYLDLTVSDDDGMTGISDRISIPYSSNFNPAVRMNTSKQSYNYSEGTGPDTTISVSVYDVSGRLLENASVLFISILGNVTVSPTSSITDASGLSSTSITGGAGTVEIKAGKSRDMFRSNE